MVRGTLQLGDPNAPPAAPGSGGYAFPIDLTTLERSDRRQIEGLQVPERFLDRSLTIARGGLERQVGSDGRESGQDRRLLALDVGVDRLFDCHAADACSSNHVDAPAGPNQRQAVMACLVDPQRLAPWPLPRMPCGRTS